MEGVETFEGHVPEITTWFRIILSPEKQVLVMNVIEILYSNRNRRQGTKPFANDEEVTSIVMQFPWAMAIVLFLTREEPVAVAKAINEIRECATELRTAETWLLLKPAMLDDGDAPWFGARNRKDTASMGLDLDLPGPSRKQPEDRTRRFPDFIKGVEHAVSLDRQIKEMSDPPTTAPDAEDHPDEIPKDLTAFAERVFKAIVDETSMLDGTRRTKDGLKESVYVERLRGLSDVQIGIISWKLLGHIIDAHRVNTLCEHEIGRRIAAAPGKELLMKLNNKKLNSNRSLLHSEASRAVQSGHIPKPEVPVNQQHEQLRKRVQGSRKRARLEADDDDDDPE
ncbi:hypothetical protein QBC41DRAFT_306798 [Cercophora samala]|uniref:Uncharacterized protein n=1 Tax=Cercophora samala TaxID=330535 RepID=A0AA39Z4L9_9PEZI|nr:hypothetical protein QBC41DRAFT_306798 [Cercophora samala]